MTPNKIKKLRERLIEFRARYNLSQEALARLLPCSTAAVQSWETGRRRPHELLFRALRDLELQMRGEYPHAP